MREAVNTSSNNHSAIESALASLQPLRDLSRNWDVDIASCLEEYLQELGGVAPGQLQQQESQSSDKQLSQSEAVPNFAHAALILQNSSNVYSRKVEYLHSLVYKALYEFFKSTSGSNSKEARRKSTDAAIDEFNDFDPHEDFLLLDDMVPEDMTIHKINLKEDDDDQPLCTTPNQSLTRTRLSLGGLSVTRAERSSLGGGFASSSQQRALLGTLNNGSLRLVNGRCDVGEDGVLLMPGSSSQPSTTSVKEPEGRRSLFGDEAPMPMDLPVEQNDDYDEHSNDGPGFAMNDDEPESVAGENQAPEVIGITLQQQQEPTKRVTFQDVKPKRGDPWALLDPHSSEGNTQKPLRKGKTYRLPEGVDLPPSDCVTGASTRRIPQRRALPRRQEVKTCLAAEAFQAYLGNRGQPPKIPINGLVFGEEFAYIAKETAKKRASARRAERKKEQQEQTHGQPATYDDDEEDYGGGYDFGGDDDHDDENNDIGNAGMSSLDDAFQNHADSEESNLGKTFEELCRAHIQAFAKGAEDFALNTQLSDRVNKWQAKLAPILEEEERRAEFDIHKYSGKIIDAAQQGMQRTKRKSDGSTHVATKTVDFETVTNNCTQSDVCRLFLASLSLANSGNLQIEEGSPIFRFDLLSSNVERPMETYRAPSVVDGA